MERRFPALLPLLSAAALAGCAASPPLPEAGSAADVGDRAAHLVKITWKRTGNPDSAAEGEGWFRFDGSETLRGNVERPRRSFDPGPLDGVWWWEASGTGGEPAFREFLADPTVLRADFPGPDGTLSGGAVPVDSSSFSALVPNPDRSGASPLFFEIFEKKNGKIRSMGRWLLNPAESGEKKRETE